MTKRKAIRRSAKAMSYEELEKRRYHSEVRQLKRKCSELALNILDIGEAGLNDICVLSNSEYEIGERREFCVTENKNYFLTPHDYEMYKKSEDE